MSFLNSRFVYWASTGVFSLALTAGGAVNVLGLEEQAEALAHLGFPAYMLLVLGAAQLFAAGAVLAPGLPLLKEWAYAGLCFMLMGAAWAHIRTGDPPETVMAPIFVWAAGACSYLSRPPARRLP